MPACASPTEIVLVIDTDLTVPVDIDQVEVAIMGSQAAAPIRIDLTAPGSPTFPLTLGLIPADGPGPVRVSVIGSSQFKPVVQQDVATTFVDGSMRMLRMVLLRSCSGITCTADNTCGADGCGPGTVPPSSLPPWTGKPPARPVPPMTLPIGGRTVWSSGWHSCANEGTTLYCWGQNSDGEIGNDSTRNAGVRRPVMNIPTPTAVGLGQFVTCTCDSGGLAWCWGRNVEGELGIGVTSLTMSVPTQVPGIADCAQIGGGAQHTCVVHRGGTVSCWGSNSSGQAGQSPAGKTPLTSPAAVAGLTNVAEIRAGEAFTCARKNDMTVWCWGDNSSGQLGDGTQTARALPAVVSGLGADIVELAIGRFIACARHATGHVSCWGANEHGQLGTGTTTASNIPIDVVGVADAAQMAIGIVHVCVVRRSGILSCWGGNQNGQLGIGLTVDSLMPVDVGSLHDVTSIAAGSVHTCARHSQGLACWGENIVNQIGDGTTTDRFSPVSVAGFL